MKTSSGTQPILYPQVSQVPSKMDPAGAVGKEEKLKPGEFEKVLDQTLKFSNHATERLRDRHITFDAKTMNGIRMAVEKAEAKGLGDALVLTPDAALIVNVKNKTVVTAMDRGSLSGNVFTNIDGAVIV